jgi:hypothetical protein
MASKKFFPPSAFLYLLLVPGLSAQTEAVLIRAQKPYTNLVRAIESNGGRVIAQYQYFDGIAAEISRGRFDTIAAIAGPGNLFKDLIVPAPAPVRAPAGRNLVSSGEETRVYFDSSRAISGPDISAIAAAQPSAYLLNSSIAGASTLHAAGITGNGVIAAGHR